MLKKHFQVWIEKDRIHPLRRPNVNQRIQRKIEIGES
jgi:hypothetical protein